MTRLTVSKFGNPGFIKDVAQYAIQPQAFDEVRNVRFNSVGAESFPGEAVVMSPAGFNPLWLKVFPPVDNPIWVYAGLDRVFAFNSGHFDITRASGPYNGQVNERWQGEVLNGIGLFNNVIDPPQMWLEFDVAEKLQDLTFWPANTRCKFLRSFKNFAMAGYIIESGNERPYRIRWSDAAAPGTIPSSWALDDPTKFSSQRDIAETSDYLVDGLPLGELFIVYKQRSVFAMQFIGPPDIFAHWKIIDGRGMLWRDCVTAFPGGHFVAGIDDLYVHNGSRNSSESIVEAKLRNWIFNQIDSQNFFNCFTVDYQRRNEIWFCFPEAGETYATVAAVWNRVTGGIGIRDLRATPFIYPGPIEQNPEGRIWGGIGPPVLSGILNGNDIELEWTVPDATDLTITSYILYRRVDGGAWANYGSGAETFLSTTDSSLAGVHTYEYYVVAASFYPEVGEESNVVSFVVPDVSDGERDVWASSVLFVRTQGAIGTPQTPNGYLQSGGVFTDTNGVQALVTRGPSFTGGTTGAFEVRITGTDMADGAQTEDITVEIGEIYHVGTSTFKTITAVTLLSSDIGTDQGYAVGHQRDVVPSSSGFSVITMRGGVAIRSLAPASGSVARTGLLDITGLTTLESESQLSFMRQANSSARDFVINGGETVVMGSGSVGQEVLSSGSSYTSLSSLSSSGTSTDPFVDVGLIFRGAV